jgi:spermidine synthase
VQSSMLNVRKSTIFSPNIILMILFFFSGFSALVYQIIWFRKFSLVFGVDVFALATVLSAFMGGLALGNFVFGRLADKLPNTLQLFALLEFGIGIFALAFPVLFNGLTSVYAHLYHVFSPPFYEAQIMRFLLAFFLLLVPTTLMGGTLPVLSKFTVKTIHNLGWNVGALYFANNLGALLGCFMAGFFLIVHLGLSGSLILAASINLGNACVVFSLQKWLNKNQDSVAEKKATDDGSIGIQDSYSYPAWLIRLVLWCFAIEGFAALAYEVFWTRILLGFSYDKGVYFTTVIIMSFIFGLALGSILVARWIDHQKKLIKIFGLVEFFIGLFSILILPLFSFIAQWLVRSRFSYGEDWWRTLGSEYLAFFAAMIIPTTLMGMTFPIVSKICTPYLKNLGRRIGWIGSLDTVGSILGSFVAGFILIPALGVVTASVLVALLNLIIGIFFIMSNPQEQIKNRLVTSGVCFLAILISLAFVPKKHYFKYWQTSNAGDRLLFYKEGASATVAVPQHPDGIKVLAIDGAVTAFAEYGDIRVHKMLGYLPFLLRPQSQNSLVIGLGMGITAESLVQPHPMSQVRCVELCPEVADAAEKCFAQENKNILHNAQLDLVFDDGRSHLMITTQKYDIITSNAIHVRHSGNIYTQDFYSLCREKLSPSGVMCQWMSTNWITRSEFKSLLQSFILVFPHSYLWCVNPGHILLIGSVAPVQIDFQKFSDHFIQNKVKNDLSEVHLDNPYTFLSQYVCDINRLSEYVNATPPHTDDKPIVEYSRVVSKAQNPDIIEDIIDFKVTVPDFITNIDSVQVEQLKRYNHAESCYLRAMLSHFYPDRGSDAVRLLRDAIASVPDDYHYREELASLYYNQGNYALAIAEMEKAVCLRPTSAADYEHLAMIYLDSGDMERAQNAFLHAIELSPENPLPHYHLASIYSNQKKYDLAEKELNTIIKDYPDFAGSYYNLAIVYLLQEQYNKAARYMEQCLTRDRTFRDAEQVLKRIYKKIY